MRHGRLDNVWADLARPKSEPMPAQESQGISSEQLDLVEQIECRILLIRGHKVFLDSDLAKLYGVSTGTSMSRCAETTAGSLQILCLR